jgi:hypothetical protein
MTRSSLPVRFAFLLAWAMAAAPACGAPVPVETPTSIRGKLAASPIIAGPAMTGSNAPPNLTFTECARQRINQVESKFRYYTTDFSSGASFGMDQVTNTGGTVTSPTNSSPGSDGIQFTGSGQVAYTTKGPLQNAWSVIALDIAKYGDGPTTDIVEVGARKKATVDGVFCRYNNVTRNLQIISVTSGTETVQNQSLIDGPPRTIYCIFNGRFCIAATAGSGKSAAAKVWCSVDISSIWDVRTTANLAAMKAYFSLNQETGKTVIATGFRHGIFGPMGSSGHELITYNDGTPIMVGNKYFFTVVNATFAPSLAVSYTGLGSAIHSLDLTTFEEVEEGRIFFWVGGKMRANGLNKICLDPATNIWTISYNPPNVDELLNTSLGDTVRYCTYTGGDLLHGVHYIDDSLSATIGVSGQTTNLYDDDRFYYNGIWYESYTKTDSATVTGTAHFHPALASGPDLAHLTEIAVDTTRDCEGQKFCKVGGAWYVTTAGQRNVGSFSCYDLTGAFAGGLNADTITGSSNTDLQSHSQIIPVMRGDGLTEYYMMNFMDDFLYADYPNSGSFQFSYGTLVIQKAAQTNTGWEHKRYWYPYAN